MGRPSKSVTVNSKNLTKEEKEKRSGTEDKLRGKSDKIKPGTNLSKAEKKIFKIIVSELQASNILGNLDIFILDTCSIAIARLRVVENAIAKKLELLDEKQAEEITEEDKMTIGELIKLKESYSKDFYRCCNELCLSPQSRAKLGNLNLKKDEEDPVLNALGLKSK